MFRKVIGQKPGTSQEAADAPTPLEPTPPAAPAPSTTPPAAASTPEPAPAAPQQRPVAASRNVLSSDVEIKGTVKFTNDLVVDGKIEGEISSEGNLTVGENARLKAEIKTATVVVYGKVHGNITAADRVDLKSTAEVVGDIKAKTLSIESGAIFVGKSTVGTPSTPAQSSAPAKPQGTDNSKGDSKGDSKGGGNNQGASKPQQGNLTGIKG
mgnify:CR=1 FL=1